jgi:hypothetical protein
MALLSPCLGIGCSDGMQNVGTTDTASQGFSADPGDDRYAPGNTSQFTGHWIGEADDVLASASGTTLPFRFPSGSTRLELELDFTQENVNSGEALGGVRFGEAEAPARATDPDAGYPAGVDYRRMPQGASSVNLPPVEGFAYSLYPASYTPSFVTFDEFDAALRGELPDGVLRLSYGTYELFGDWCALQDPLPPGAEGYGCKAGATAYGGAGTDAGGNPTCELQLGPDEREPIDCNQMALCYSFGVCVCNEDFCQDASPVSKQSELWLRPSNDGLEGVFVDAIFLNEKGLPASPSVVRFRPAE